MPEVFRSCQVIILIIFSPNTSLCYILLEKIFWFLSGSYSEWPELPCHNIVLLSSSHNFCTFDRGSAISSKIETYYILSLFYHLYVFNISILSILIFFLVLRKKFRKTSSVSKNATFFESILKIL